MSDFIARQSAAIARRDRLSRSLAIGGVLAFGALLATVRLDAGYCPDPENYQEQPYEFMDFSKNGLGIFPDSLHANLAIPFTDLETSKIPLYVSSCQEPGDSSEETPNEPPQPTCDERTIYRVDGQEVDRTETHYPGAITTNRGVILPPQ